MKVKIVSLPEQNKVIAISKYGGKNIKAVAKTAPEDEFNAEVGEAIATARVIQKVNSKKLAWANRKYLAAEEEHERATRKLKKATKYLNDVYDQLQISKETLEAIEKHYS